MKYSGLHFQKFDLHVHTPGSHDFDDKTITPKQIVDKAIERGLCAIAITDHNTGEWVDKVKDAAKGTSLTVFPGVEIYCTGGKEGIHVIGILNTDQGTKHIESLLAKVGIDPDDFGTAKAVTACSPIQVIDEIYKCGGIGVLAHSTSSKGVMHDIIGLTRNIIFEHPGLLAVESSHHDFTDPEKIKKKTRAIDLLNGEDENYNFRRLAVYIASDSKGETDEKHNIEGIGGKYTYFKVDDSVDLESLRQCFIDRDVRIRQYFDYKPKACPQIKSVSIRSGFFDGQSADFHKGLNSILGAKGSGKSLLVELMRFCLGQVSSQREIYDDHMRKLQKKLGTFGVVKVIIIDETGAEQEIERVFNPPDSPYSKPEIERMATAFPVLFLSQNEIVKIAEEETEQIKFIDNFFDFRHYQNKIRNIERDLSVLDQNFADGLRGFNDLTDIKKQLVKNQADLERLNKMLSDPIYDKYKLVEQKDRALRAQETTLISLRDQITSQKSVVEKINSPTFEEPTRSDPAIMRNDVVIKKLKEDILNLINAEIDKIDKSIQEVRNEYNKWKVVFQSEKANYEEHIRKSGGDRKDLEAHRLRVVKEIDDLKKREALLVEKTKSLGTINQEREALMRQLFSIYADYSKERKAKCEKFEKESRGRLQVKIHESTNIDEFKNQLLELKKGSYLRDVEIDDICKKVSPHDFILTLLRYFATNDRQTKDKYLNVLTSKIGIEKQRLQTLFEYLISQVKYEDLLRLQYMAHPQDRPEIKFRINEKQYELIRDISVGQKCTAMLIMALSDGKFPIVIDQPEDSLDVRSVWDDMCVKIREGKESRQFIFTTHNSCLAVASDTDKYTIIEGNDANSASIVLSGALEAPTVKNEVIRYLEGGELTYRRKASKYGIELFKD